MKAKEVNIIEEFNPVTIEITFETKEEMKAFKSITEYTVVTDVFRRAGISINILNEAIPCKSHLENGEWDKFVRKVRG